jgi:RNA polymerase sigma-70 factor, ECF subfamily
MVVDAIGTSREAMTGAPARGDEFEDFFRVEYPRLLRALVVVAGSPSESEELAQEAMARAYERWSRVRELDHPAAYVYTIAVNFRRNRLRALRISSRKAISVARTPRSSGSVEAWSDLLGALRRLPAGQRDALILTAWFGLTATEAAETLGIAPASVRSRIHRAREALSEQSGD